MSGVHRTLQNEEEYSKDIEKFKSQIVTYHDFPKPGVTYKDAFTAIRESSNFRRVVDILAETIAPLKPDAIVGLESRGFLLTGALSYALNVPFVLIRKTNKLPGPCKQVKYSLHYGEDTLEIQEDAVKPGQRVVIVDDAVATGGTMKATSELIHTIGGVTLGAFVILELENLGWEAKLKNQNVTSIFRL